MPVLMFTASTETPVATLRYNMDPGRMLMLGTRFVEPGEPKEMSDQMMRTMRLFGKSRASKERKFYHVEIYFHPSDLQQNGGTVDVAKAKYYAAEYAEETWPDHEVVWIIHDHGSGIHLHFIVAACSVETGKKLNVRFDVFRTWRNNCQLLAQKYGLSSLDLYE